MGCGTNQTRGDFVVNTNRHCFICLEQVSPPPSHFKLDQTSTVSSSANSTYSLQCLSRYLKLDMKKVFDDTGSISNDLLSKVERSNLKVELCSECASFNNKFSQLFRKFEKITMEMASRVNIIYEKLERKNNDQCLRLIGTDSNLNGGFSDEKLKIVNNLRTEAIQKCQRKIRKTSKPKIKVERLSEKKILRETVKKSDKQKISPNLYHEDVSDSETMQTDEIKMEEFNDENPPEEFGADETPREWNAEQMQIPTAIKIKPQRTIDSTSNISGFKGKGSNGKPRVNPKTGKFNCSSCSMEFATYWSCDVHYKTFHLNIRFKCVKCGSLFTQKSNLDRHIKTNHLGQR